MASALEDRLRDRLSAAPADIVAAYLFGSRARGSASGASDVDLALLLREAPPRTLLGQPFDLEDDLRGLLGLEVQLLVLNRAPPDVTHRVFRDGVLLIDRDPSFRIRFEVAARNAYFDLKPYLDRYRARV